MAFDFVLKHGFLNRFLYSRNEIDYDNHTFNFSKSHWIKGFRMDDPKTYNGKYVANKQDGGKIELTIYV